MAQETMIRGRQITSNQVTRCHPLQQLTEVAMLRVAIARFSIRFGSKNKVLGQKFSIRARLRCAPARSSIYALISH